MRRKLPSYYELHIYGEGECKSEIVKTSEQCNNIILHGFNSQEIILGELENSIALIAPYLWYEGYPMVIAESFSVGCPVVATDNGNAGNIIFISNGGVVYKTDDNTSFYDSLEKIIIDNQFYRDNAKRYFEKELNSKRNYEGLRDIYDKCKVI